MEKEKRKNERRKQRKQIKDEKEDNRKVKNVKPKIFGYCNHLDNSFIFLGQRNERRKMTNLVI